MVEAVGDIIAGLWDNGRDSIAHALYHFSERDHDRSMRWHHNKWIVLSVHHAAECVCSMRLLELDPNCTVFHRKDGIHFPSLKSSIECLRSSKNSTHLSKAELALFDLLEKIKDTRDELMHRTAPKDLDVSISAMCMIGILKYIELTKGVSTSDFFMQRPPVETDVVSAIHYTKLDEYSRFVELFLREKYSRKHLPECPSCGVHAVVSSTCEACFEEIAHVRCSNCDEEIYFMAWERYHGDHIVKCQECGTEQAL